MTDPRSIAVDGALPRRSFLASMGAAFAAAGLAACTRAPRERIFPYVVQPAEVTPGRPRFYATAFALDGYATGLLVESHEGRPTKVEGNPDHPASLGATSAPEQGLVLGLYDPRRLGGAAQRGSPIAWSTAESALRSGAWTRANGRGLHVLSEPTSSPTLAATLDALRDRWPAARVHFHAPATPRNVWEGARLAFGSPLEPRLDLGAADVIVALDADVLAHGRAGVRHARAFADGRRLRGPSDAMNRLYAVEAVYTETGAAADHRLRVRASEVVAIAAALLAAIGPPELPGGAPAAFADPPAAAPHRPWIRAVAKDLAAHRGRSVVIAGDEQPPILHAIAWAINATLGNLGKTVSAAPSPVLGAGGSDHDLVPLADALRAGEVDTLVVLGTNAAYTAPADVPFGALVAKARESAYLGLYPDETAAACNITLGGAHPLESWGDARAFDGTVSIVQPLIEPLLGGRTSVEVLASIAQLPSEGVYESVRDTFAGARRASARDVDARWQRALTRGVVEGSEIALAPARIVWGKLAAAFAGATFTPSPSRPEVVLTLDPRLHDGRFAENAWLLELPEPITKLAWTNAATLGPATAASLRVDSGDELELGVSGRAVRAPALVVPGQAEGTIGLALGWGRAGERGSPVHGANAYLLRTSSSPHVAAGATVNKTGARIQLPITQGSHDLHGRDEQILRTATLAEFRALATAPRAREKRLSLYGVRPPDAEQWAMTIDLTVCTGCGSCVVACQAENNVPTVGATGVLKSRQMHWLRIDTYHLGDPDDPRVVSQPMLCQHCEMAPCEYVCPVNATVHSGQGLNEMVYNRCVGTRFCSNNCPYKVRRFNWFDYHADETPTAQLAHNPDVTVRARGVMEKCTFCVQRIREHEIRRVSDRSGSPPPLVTACQQACPTKAIVFGDKASADSEVSRLGGLAHGYAALDELGTLPRVRYLARIRNPNPELA